MRDVFLPGCRISLYVRRKCGLPLFVCRDHSTPPLLGSKHGMGSLRFRWLCADNFWVLIRGANNTDVHLGCKRRPVSMFTTYLLASGSADVSRYEVSPANAYCCGIGKWISPMLSRTDGMFAVASAVGRWTSSVGHESFRALSKRGALSIMDASFKFARVSDLVSGEPWSTVRVEQRAFVGILCFLWNDWDIRWLDVCIYRMHRKRASLTRFVKVASWFRRTVGSQSGQGSREARSHACASLHRSGCRFGNIMF